MWQCNPMFEHKDDQTAPVSPVKVDLESEKSNIAEDLRECSDKIDRRITAVDEQLNKPDQKEKNNLDQLRTKLVREKKKVEGSLKDVERSSVDTWKTINKKASRVLTDAKIETQKIEERIEDLID